MERNNTEVLNTNETEISEEKKDGEGVDTVDNLETGEPTEVINNPANAEQIKTGKDNGKKRIQHTGLKNGKIIVFDGAIVEFDEDGIAEIDKKYADYLLKIPSYTEA
ncbi:hypothetical protein [Treponema pedis]|uniref:hypothetical protein n=1 Tax=Treponema pedis TaxID=409322 RepID=UPI003D1DF40E